MEEQGNSPSSSIDSSNYPSLSSSSLSSQPQMRDLSTDLKLGLSLSASSLQDASSNIARDQLSDWPPIKPLLRSALASKGNRRHPSTFFVKVYMEGIPIGRKLDLFALDGYEDLIEILCRMFRTSIMCPNVAQVPSSNIHVLTYEDKEGDLMMVGDVPWEMFLTTVKRLKITRA